MQPLRIVPVKSKAEQTKFIELPTMLHGHDPQWVPALGWEEKRLLGFVPGHPFPEENRVHAWLAYRGSQPVGRIAAAICKPSDETNDESVGFFGFFACGDDQQAATQLVSAAANWVDRLGLQKLRGPFSPNINYGAGVLQDGFDRNPSFQIPYNPPYYTQLLEQAGLNKVQDLYALEISREQLMQVVPRLERVASRLNDRYQIQFRQLNPRHKRRDLQLFLSIAQQSLQDHWGFVPLSRREQNQLVADMRWVVVPELIQFAEIDGQTVAAALALPDYAPRIRQIKGRLLPTGFMKLLWAKRRTRQFRVVATNILPGYDRLGIAPALISRIARTALNLGAESLEFSWIAESNPLSFGTIENGGAQRSKTIRVYEAPCSLLLNRQNQSDSFRRQRTLVDSTSEY